MNSITLSHDQATRLLHSLQHLHTLHGPCDGLTCPHAAVLRELEGLIYLASASPEPPNGETFTDSQIGAALFSFLQYGEQTFVGEGDPMQFGQRGYFSGEGWAARCLRYHLFQREGKRALEDLRNTLKTGNHDPRSWGKEPDPEREAFLKDAQADPEFQAVAPFPCQDPHDLADALLRVTALSHLAAYTPTPRLCAACGAALPSTTSAKTNLCGRCAL